jgi:hypothetical protein
MALPSLPLWSLGAVLIVAGPWAVQRIADVWTKRVEKRTDEAIAAALRPDGDDEKAAPPLKGDADESSPTDSTPGGSHNA